MFQLKINIKPVGVNHAYVSGTSRRFLSPEAKAYKEVLQWEAQAARCRLFIEPKVTLTFTYGDNRKRDIDSAIKLTLDAFNGLLWIDDSKIEELHVFKKKSLKNPSVEIIVEET